MTCFVGPELFKAVNTTDPCEIDLTDETGDLPDENLPAQGTESIPKPRKRRTWSTAERIVVHDTLKEHNNSIAAALRYLSLKYPSVYGSLRESTVRGWFKECLPVVPAAPADPDAAPSAATGDGNSEVVTVGTDLSDPSSKESSKGSKTSDKTVVMHSKAGPKQMQLQDKKVRPIYF